MGSIEIEAFNDLKSALVKEPVLKIYDRNAKTEVHTDASIKGFGATMLQWFDGELHPVYFWSKKATDAEAKHHSYVLEAKAIYLALKKFRHYLLGIKFKLVTDCNAFKQTLKKADVPREVVQWVICLEEFSFEVEHRAGDRLKHVDCLSRYPQLTMMVTCEVTARVKRSQQRDDSIKAIVEILNTRPYEDYKIKGELLYKCVEGQDLLVIPRDMEKQIISDIHSEGHFGLCKTMHAIKQRYFIPHLERKVKLILNSCVKCIIHNKKLGRKEGFLHPIDKGDQPLQTLHLDHVGPMDATGKQYKYVLTVVDGFSKFVWLYPTKTTGAEETLRKLECWSTIFGYPARIVTDRGSAFTANAFGEYANRHGIQHVVCTTGVPRGNGQAERVNRTMLSVLTKLSSEDPGKWFKVVPSVQRAINSHIHVAAGKSPFELMFGTKMRTSEVEDLSRLLEEEAYDRFDCERQEMRKGAKNDICNAQNVYKKHYDLSRKPEYAYVVGDLVAIKRTQFVAGRKLASEFLGPYEVIKINRNGRYKVKRAANCEGPNITTTSCDNMKLWSFAISNDKVFSEDEAESENE